MNSPLTAMLLGESPTPPARRPVNPAVAPRYFSSTRPGNVGPPARAAGPIREHRRAGLRRTLSEAVSARDTVTITYQEAKAILRMFEELEADPFISGDGKFNQTDLGNLGIEANVDTVDSSGPGSTQKAPASNDANANLLSPSLAVMAPEATPNEDDAPPPAIASALQAFEDGPEEPADPVLGQFKDEKGEFDLDSIMALARGNGVPENDGALPSRAERATRRPGAPAPIVESAPVEDKPDTGGWQDAMNALKKGRKIVQEKKIEAQRNARAKKGIA